MSGGQEAFGLWVPVLLCPCLLRDGRLVTSSVCASVWPSVNCVIVTESWGFNQIIQAGRCLELKCRAGHRPFASRPPSASFSPPCQSRSNSPHFPNLPVPVPWSQKSRSRAVSRSLHSMLFSFASPTFVNTCFMKRSSMARFEGTFCSCPNPY